MASKQLLAATVLALATTPTFAVYKCKDAAGKLSYQEHPCTATGTQGEQIKAAPAITTGNENSQASQERLEASKNYNRRFDAAANQQVMRGMSKDQVTLAWGSPSSVNRTIGSYGTHEQWVYRNYNARTQYVYFENGVVTAIQD